MAAIVTLNQSTQQLIIYSKLVLYGTEATELIAQKIKQELETLYNEPVVDVTLNDIDYHVIFKIDYEILPAETIAVMALNNQDSSLNFIRIEAANDVTRSFMGFGLGENSGHWITSDQLGESTTVAHEFGHCLGLDHPTETDFRGSGTPPPIMAPRGTIVDTKYQWNPTVAAGEFGGTMKPIYRRVKREEVLAIIQNIQINQNGMLHIGQLTNRVFDTQGSEVLFA